MEKILECVNLNKSFGKKQVLFDINLSLEAGDILGFVGPNGSGKTTTIKLILGLQKIDKGSVKINGYDIEKDFVKAIEKVGCIVENPDNYMYLSGYDNLMLVKNMYPKVTKADVLEIIKIVGLENRIHDKVKKYSLGMRQRLGIACALINKPNILFLDEPTNGLDPAGIRELRTLLKRLAKEGIGILISSHNLAELETFCNKICIIQNGHIKETNDLSALKRINGEYAFEVDDSSKINELLPDAVIIDEKTFTIKTKKEEIPLIINKLINNQYQLYEVKSLESSLEDVFLSKTEGNKID